MKVFVYVSSGICNVGNIYNSTIRDYTIIMHAKEVSTFLDNDYADSALYINFRSMPNVMDGLKQSGRKVVYVCKKKALKEPQKVSNLAGAVIDASQYLHGNTSLEGVIVTLAQDYCGANNIPLLEGVGSFGTRMFPQPSASRYIFAKQQPYFNLLFNPADDVNMEKQYFEGSEIEPRFYVPALPLVLINGGTGIGVGFSSRILGRSVENMITVIRNTLQGKRNLDRYFHPQWKGFKGSVVKIGDNKWEISGVMSRKGKSKVEVTELPVPYTWNDYMKTLRTLRDAGVIKKFSDNSDPSTDTFGFEITLDDSEAEKSDSEIMSDLKLVNTITECFTCIDRDNAIKEYSSAREIFEDYFNVRMEYLRKRIDSETERLSKEVSVLDETYRFISGVVKGAIKVSKLNRKDLESLLESKGFTAIDRLTSLPIYSLTLDKAQEAKDRLDMKMKELEEFRKETPESQWTKDLDAIESALKGR